jgi:hypothetical protein
VSTPGKSFDPSAVSRPNWIAAGGSLILLITVFLSWYTYSIKGAGSFGGASGNQNGWDSGAGAKLVALLALIALVAIGIEMFAPTVTLPVPASLIVIGAGGLSILLVLLKIVSKPDGHGVVSVGLAYGIFVSFLAAVVTAYGGYLKMNEK